MTWADGQIVYCSHAGAIVAVDAWTGQPTWGVRYPSRGPLRADLEPSARDLAPCLSANGRVYAAPLDSDRVFCIDAVTGQVRWELEAVEIAHLLGVADGPRPVHDARRHAGGERGDRAERMDAAIRAKGRLCPSSLGRGLLAGSEVYWPTQDAQLPYRVLGQATGQQVLYSGRLWQLPVGNLALGHGCLAIAGLDELAVYVPAHHLPLPPIGPRPQARIDRLYQEARQQASAGAASAARTYLELLETTKTDRNAQAWRKLIEGRLLTLVSRPPGTAVFTDPRMPPTVRLSAWQREAAIMPNDDFVKRVLHDSALRQAWLPGAPPEQGVAWAVRQSAEYLGDPDDAVALYHFAKRYGTPDPLVQLAERSLQAKRWGAAADAYRRLLALPIDDDLRARAEAGLARAYAVQPQRSPKSAIDGPALPLVRAWSHDDGRALDRGDDFFFCAQPGQVTCRNDGDGAPRWRRSLDFMPTSLHRWHDLVIFAGPDMVQALRIDDGEATWSFPAPSRIVPIGRVIDGIPQINDAGGFVHVERWDDTLLLLDDCRAFFRLRLDTGEVAWHHSAASMAAVSAACPARRQPGAGANRVRATRLAWDQGRAIRRRALASLDRVAAFGRQSDRHGRAKAWPHSCV